MTTFKSALAICGLTQTEAAEFLGVSVQSVKNWGSGKSAPPMGVWTMLSDLYRRIEDAADDAASMIEPALVDRVLMNNIDADCGSDPLPGGADGVAGAMALLLAIQDVE